MWPAFIKLEMMGLLDEGRVVVLSVQDELWNRNSDRDGSRTAKVERGV